MLERGDPARLKHSFTLFERSDGVNRVRVHADNVDSEAPDPRWAGELAKLKDLLANQKAAV